MIHSRPGFAPRHSDRVPAKLNDDMIPAINRKPLTPDSNLKGGGPEAAQHQLDARTEAAMAKLAREHPPTELLVNPTPSDPPKILTPGK
jgi:hypothetical protein